MNCKLVWPLLLVLWVSTPSNSLAQAGQDAEPSKLGVYLASWIPLLIIFGVLFWFTKYARQTQTRARLHMDAVEKKLDRIVDILEGNQKGR